MRIARKYAIISRQEANAIASGRKWYPKRSLIPLREMGWLNGKYPANVFDLPEPDGGVGLDVGQVLTALAMVIAVARTTPGKGVSIK